MTTQCFEIHPVGSFDLSSYIHASGGGLMMHPRGTSPNELQLAFLADDFEHAVGVRLRQTGSTVHAAVSDCQADIDLVRRQIERMLGLDVDARRFDDLAVKEPVIGRLRERFPGLRHYGFASPYESAVRFVIGQRMRITQAAVIRQRLADAHGGKVTFGETIRGVVPSPRVLLGITEFPGINAAKIKALHAVATAAHEGGLDAEVLRSLPHEFALAHLQKIHGIGPFSAEGILIRGAVAPDALPTNEPRLKRAVARAYGLCSEPDDAQMTRISDGWRPFRGWVCHQLRRWLEDETHEISRK